MLVSWKWLNELVEIHKTPEELADLLTMSGVAVEGIKYPEIELKNLKVGLIEEITPHPDADKLVICRLNVGGGEKVSIVTGARNVCEGQMVPVALSGAVLAGGKRIESAELRGVRSEGMLCSAAELGMDLDKIPTEQKEGIYILPDDVSIGADAVQVLNLDDIVLELELTPNRSDCLGMWNVAREVAALTGGKLSLPGVEDSVSGGACADMTQVEIQNEELCGRYVARIIKEVQVAPSPLWMQQRLIAAGVRPINNVVDVTNYVMMETGQPLHSFDYDRLREKRIVVRRAGENEELVTLDGQLRKLNPEMLVIADAVKPVAIAGVMGGLETEVTEKTRIILLESAFFNGPSVRRTSHVLGLRSEASLRFEKTVDVEQTRLVADRAVQLLCQIGAGFAVTGCFDCYPARAQAKQQEKQAIKLRIKRVNQILGTKLKPIDMEVILKALRITFLEKKQDGWLVLPPSYRQDLQREIDLIEEIARLYSYEQIPTTLPEGGTTQGLRSNEQKIRYQIRKKMIAQGLLEVINYSFVSRENLEIIGIPIDTPFGNPVAVQNPLSEEQGVMRTTLLPGLLETVKRNINKQNKNLQFFELGKVFCADGFPEKRKLPLELWSLGAVSTGKREKSWAYGPAEYDFYYLKGVVVNLLVGLGYIEEEVTFASAADVPGLHPGRTALIQIKGQEIGVLGEVHPLVLEKFGIEQRVTTFSLEVEKIWNQEGLLRRSFLVPITKFPAISRDLAIIAPEEISAAEVAELIREQGNEWLKAVRLFDLYRGQQIKANHKSLAFSLTWQAPDKTLTDEEINVFHRKIEGALAEKFGAGLRY